MKPSPSRPASTESPPRRATRPRPTPSWLLEQQDLDEMARRRTLMVLSVLSGEKAVTDAVAEANISRQLYYQLETKALHAVLRAMAPGAESKGSPGADGYLKRISELEEQVKRLQQDKRRNERLLFLTRKVVKRGPLSSETRGRPRRTKSSSTKRGVSSSTASTPASASPPTEPPSTSSRDGANSP